MMKDYAFIFILRRGSNFPLFKHDLRKYNKFIPDINTQPGDEKMDYT